MNLRARLLAVIAGAVLLLGCESDYEKPPTRFEVDCPKGVNIDKVLATPSKEIEAVARDAGCDFRWLSD